MLVKNIATRSIWQLDRCNKLLNWNVNYLTI